MIFESECDVFPRVNQTSYYVFSRNIWIAVNTQVFIALPMTPEIENRNAVSQVWCQGRWCTGQVLLLPHVSYVDLHNNSNTLHVT